MQKIIRNGNGGTIACPEGTWNAILNEVFEIGVMPGFEDGQENFKRAYVFLTDQKIQGGKHDGESYVVSSLINDSTHQKSRLYGLIRSLCGRDLSQGELDNLDLESLLGKPCIIEVEHQKKTDGTVSPRISKISRHLPGLPVLTRQPSSETPQWVIKLRDRRLDKPTANKITANIPTTQTTQNYTDGI